LLKPILYAAALSEGQILPKSFLKDVPTKIGGFSPENFDRDYSGAVPADIALARSLNVPFVYLLKEFGISKFLFLLRSIGFDKIKKFGLLRSFAYTCGAESSLKKDL
jgi:penicillin-binding protein 1C